VGFASPKGVSFPTRFKAIEGMRLVRGEVVDVLVATERNAL